MKGEKSHLNPSGGNHISWLPPDGYITTQEFIISIKNEVKKLSINDYGNIIRYIKDPGLALGVTNIVFNKFNTKDKELLLKILLENYSYEALKNYTINQDETAIIHKIYESEIEFKFEPKSLQGLDGIVCKIEAQKNGFFVAVAEKNIQIMEEITKNVLNTAQVTSKLLVSEVSHKPHHQPYLQLLQQVVIFIKPEQQHEIIQNLIDTTILDLNTISSFSRIFHNAKKYEKVITLLKSKVLDPKLLSLLTNEKEVLYDCWYYLHAAYYNTGELILAEEPLRLMLEAKPNNSNFYNLFTLYKLNEKFTEANNLIQKASPEIKTFTKMLTDPKYISKDNLDSIEQINLPDNCKNIFRIFQYTAKYKGYTDSEKILKKEELKNELIKISEIVKEPLILAQYALYTEQYELIKQFRKKIPENMIPYLRKKINYFKQIELLLATKKSDEQFYVKDFIAKSNYSQSQAIEIINKIIVSLIANKKYFLALEHVEEILKYDNKNLDAIKDGLTVAKLVNDQERIEKYTNLLYQASKANKQEEPKEQEQVDDDYYNDGEQPDHQKIHSYYKLIKQNQLSNIAQKIFPNNNSYGSWEIKKEGKINSTDAEVIYLGKFRGLKCFGKISEKIEKRLDNNQFNKIINALTKGIISTKQGKHGVKFCSNKFVEIKINGDQRLFENILHVNKEGEILINFDHYGTHEDVRKFAGDNNLEFHQDLS